jgi:hypothetical protein
MLFIHLYHLVSLLFSDLFPFKEFREGGPLVEFVVFLGSLVKLCQLDFAGERSIHEFVKRAELEQLDISASRALAIDLHHANFFVEDFIFWEIDVHSPLFLCVNLYIELTIVGILQFVLREHVCFLRSL